MSYLVEALKKAERERHDKPAADMRSLSATEARPRRRANHALKAVVGVLVLCNIVLFAYMLVAGGGDGPSSMTTAAASTTQQITDSAPVSQSSGTASQPSGARARVGPSSGERGQTAGAGNPPGLPVEKHAVSGLRLANRPARTPARAAEVQTQSRTSGAGGVRYSQQPLDSRTDNVAAQPGDTASASAGSAAPAGAPGVRINGHLYSSIPGRSFILVQGKRYHEGERLAAGPSVVSIDARGATLNYRGQRYHINGPG